MNKYKFRRNFLSISLIAISFVSLPAYAQSQIAVNVGTVISSQECEYFIESEGTRDVGIAANRNGFVYASSTSWRSWLVKDCVDNFPNMRASLEAALASTGKLVVGDSGYSVDVSLSEISGGDPAPFSPNTGVGGYATRSVSMLANFDLSIRDGRGSAIHGGLATKSIETGFSINTDGTYVSKNVTGEAVYGKLQNEMALSMARIVAFKLVPLRVQAVDQNRIELNYGAPVLQLGALVEVKEGGRLNSIKYRVVSTQGETAIAEVDGDNDTANIKVGALATMIESDDPAANGRRFKRAKLP